MAADMSQFLYDADTTKDNLQLIHGIGPKVEERLFNSKISTYQQLAETTPDEIAQILLKKQGQSQLVGITPGRIASQDWIGQARKFTLMSANQEKGTDPSDCNNGQHYAIFMVELLLDNENRVRRTNIRYVPSRKSLIIAEGEINKSWAGWDDEQFQAFLRDFSINLPLDNPEVGIKPLDVDGPTPQLESAADLILHTSMTNLTGQFCILSLEPHYIGSGSRRQIIPADQPFNIRFVLDLSGLNTSPDTSIQYSATIYVKEIGKGLQRSILGITQGTIKHADNVIVDVGAKPLSRGSYRIETIVTLSSLDQGNIPGSGLMNMTEGLFQVF